MPVVPMSIKKMIDTARINRRAMHFSHLQNGKKNLSWKIKLSYCAPTLSTLPIVLLLAVYGTQFYETMGADLAYISFFIALARSFDVMSDPLMSYLTDSFRSKYGRRRPFIITGCWVYAILMVLLLSPPRWSSVWLSIWFGFFYVTFFLASTYTNIPYDALGPELTDDYDDRSRLFFVSGLFDGFGSLLAILIPVMLAQYIQQDPEACPVPSFSCDGRASGGVGQSCYPIPGQDVLRQYDLGPFSLASSRYADMSVPNLEDACHQLFKNKLELGNDTSSVGTDVSAMDTVDGACVPGLACFCQCVLTCTSDCAIENTRTAYMIVGLLFALWYVVTMTNCFVQIKERCQLVSENKSESETSTKREGSRVATYDSQALAAVETLPPPPMVPSMLNTLKNEPFKMLLPAWACDAVVNSIIASMMTYYIRYVIRPEYSPACTSGPDKGSWRCDSTLVLGASVASLLLMAFLSTPLWLFINTKIGKRNAWLMWSLSMAVTNSFYIFLGEGDVTACIVITAMNGLPFGAKFLADAILADIIDYDEFLSGARSEATYTMFKSFLPKICAIPASAIPLALLNSIGHVAPVNGVIQRQKPIVETYVRIVAVVIPTGISLLGFFIKRHFPFKSKNQIDLIAEGVGNHLLKKSAVDPITHAVIEYIPISKAEQLAIFRLDYFPTAAFITTCLNDNVAGERYNVLRRDKGKASIIALVALLFFSILVMSTFKFMSNPNLSVIPVLGIICVGVSATLSGILLLQYHAADALVTVPPTEAILQLALRQRLNVEKSHLSKYKTKDGTTDAQLSRVYPKKET